MNETLILGIIFVWLIALTVVFLDLANQLEKLKKECEQKQ